MTVENTEQLTKLTPELLTEFGFKKVESTDEETGKEFFHFELPLSKSTYLDFVLLTNMSDEPDFPIVRFCGVDEYEFREAEPIVLMMNLLQHSCVDPNFQLDQQFEG